jgi:hypothetical protein
MPAIWAAERAIADVLSALGTGTIQRGGGRDAEWPHRLMMRLADATGWRLVDNDRGQSARQPDAWTAPMALVDAAATQGMWAHPLCPPHRTTRRVTRRHAPVFRGLPTWHPISRASDEETLPA